MTIHLDWDEAEFWQHYESVNESVIATAHAAVRYGLKTFRLSLTAGTVHLCYSPNW